MLKDLRVMTKSNYLNRAMAIDFGTKRIGIALTDPLKKIAYPYKTLPNNNSLIDDIINIIVQMDVDLLIVGIHENKTSNNIIMNKKIEDFKSLLLTKVKIKIIDWDESFTSKIAQKKIIESVTKRKKRQNKELIDMHAAAVILSEYLEKTIELSEQ